MIRLFWFSGTGNSWFAASSLAAAFRALGRDAVLVPMEGPGKADGAGLYPAPGDRDPDIFCFPVYAFAPPAKAMAFVRSLPPSGGRPAGLVATIGRKGYEGGSLLRMARLLAKRGYAVTMADAIEMPEAFVQAFPATAPEEAKAALDEAEKRYAAFVRDMEAGAHRFRRWRFRQRILSGTAAALFGLVGRRFLGLCWAADARCTSCGLCARTCPCGNIRMRHGHPSFGPSCQACQRCANACPTGAIAISPLKLAAIVFVSIVPFGHWVLQATGLALPATARVIVEIVAWLGFAVLAIAALVFGFAFADRVPFLRDIAALSHARSFRRYLAPGFRQELKRLDGEAEKP